MATNPPNVTGMDEISQNLGKVKAALAPKVELGLKTAALFLQRTSAQLVPVDTGVLKASAFTRATGNGFNTLASTGYTALYAMWVHENLNGLNPNRFGRPRADGKGNYWDPEPRGQSKFLEMPARDSDVRKKMLNIVRNTCKIKGTKGGD